MTSQPSFWLLVWAIMLAGLAAGLWVWTAEPVAVLSLGAAGLTAAAIAAYLALRGRRRQARDAAGAEGEVRVVPDSSYAAVIVGVALANLVMGFEFGTWLVLASAGLLLVGLGAYLNERRSARRNAAPVLPPGTGEHEQGAGSEHRLEEPS